ncbi:MAG TPA: N-acetylglucosamine-6-phosphate deacetylase [Solirubrobacteraceae bacterium]|nr:N-acetylglucosamine-6-phosphate deacetylase [Solirubrobacteraceae bacterium]
MGVVPWELRLRSERIVTPAGVTAGEVAVREGRIVALRTGAAGLSHPGAGERVDLGDAWLLPGMIDGHVHGGDGGRAESADPDELVAMAELHARHGTTGLLPTLVPAPAQELLAALGAIAPARDRAPQILGTHLEGPFLSPSRAGALDPGAMRTPDLTLMNRLLSVPGADVRMMTIAPELPGALALIARLAAAGRLASLGHSAATSTEVRAAVRAGARSVTHLFNAMSSLHHREPGLVGEALDCPRLSCELIADGRHVAPGVLRIALRAAGSSRIRLVTDAIAATGRPDGEYRLGHTTVAVHDGVTRSAATGRLAGSTLTMDAALRAAVELLGLEVAEAAALASTHPARALGLDRKGAIAPGYDADLTVLDDDLSVRATLIGGRWVHGP